MHAVLVTPKHLQVELLEGCNQNDNILNISTLLDGVNKNLLNQTPWPQYNYSPYTAFAIAYGKDDIFLKFYITEKFLQAANGATNMAVYQDTCVEFFIGFGDGQTYYNIECNCIGTLLIGYGETNVERTLLPNALIDKINFQSVIGNQQTNGDKHWEITLVIPFATFCYDKIDTLVGKNCRANFYKCGDHLPEPHFIAWSNINSLQPNFHLPEFFGELQFV